MQAQRGKLRHDDSRELSHCDGETFDPECRDEVIDGCVGALDLGAEPGCLGGEDVKTSLCRRGLAVRFDQKERNTWRKTCRL